mmetsp:Transcript_34920/g.87103  ORF Transcript_34920/g.87103 Transcript_34920/m.87103 type:complete len:146 (+) Transcript_34920:68-505(+)
MEMLDVYSQYVRFGETGGNTTGLTSRNFVKLAKDAKIVDKKISTTTLDLAFTKAARALTTSGDTSWGGKRISFDQFVYALQLCAESAGCEPDVLYAKCLAVSAPSVKATIADNVKFHDDKSTFTAVARNGGPSKIDGQAWSKGLN